MATNQIQTLGQNDMFGTGLLNEHVCETFVKLSAVRSIAINANFHFFPHYKLAMEIGSSVNGNCKSSD